jgi:hypothetical protein
LGALLTLGWGTTLVSVLAPSLPARIWTMPFRDGVGSSARVLAAGVAVCGLAAAVPDLSSRLAAFAAMERGWVTVFVGAGVVRGTVQVASTLLVRQGLHTPLITAQATGRALEMLGLLVSCQGSSPTIFVLAWLVYPVTQAVALHVLRPSRQGPSAAGHEEPVAPYPSRGGGAANFAALILELIVPTAWLRLGGDAAYVVYRAVSSAVGYVVLFPRYWYVVSGSARASRTGVRFALGVVIVSVAAAVAYQWVTGLVPVELIAVSVIPTVLNAGAAPHFSRLRQNCLQGGDVTSPALATAAGKITELSLLVLSGRVLSLSPKWMILAYSADALGALVLHWRVAGSRGRG